MALLLSVVVQRRRLASRRQVGGRKVALARLTTAAAAVAAAAAAAAATLAVAHCRLFANATITTTTATMGAARNRHCYYTIDLPTGLSSSSDIAAAAAAATPRSLDAHITHVQLNNAVLKLDVVPVGSGGTRSTQRRARECMRARHTRDG